MSSTLPQSGRSEPLASSTVKSFDMDRGHTKASKENVGQLSGDTKKFLGIVCGGLIAGLSVVGYDSSAKTHQNSNTGILTGLMRPLRDTYKELRFGISPKEMDALRSRIADFFATHAEPRQHAAYSDFMKIGGIVSEARCIAKKEGGSTESTIRYAGGDAHARMLTDSVKTSLSCALDEFLSETHDEEDPLDVYRKDPTALIGVSDMIAAELGIDISDVLSDEKKRKILLVGMKRCMKAWDPTKGPFDASSEFGRFARVLTMRLHGTHDTQPAIHDVLMQDNLVMDPASETQLQGAVNKAQKMLAAQYPASLASENH